jgi:hypothetical protein
MTQEQLAVIEKNAHAVLSNMDGENFNFDGDGYEGDNYDGDSIVGEDNAFVDFAGDFTRNLSSSFSREVSLGKLYTFTITNNNLTDEEYFISKGINILDPVSGYFAGQMAEGTFNSIAGNPLIGKGAPGNINKFLAFALMNPMHIIGFQISSTNSVNLAKTIELEPLSPLKRLESKDIYLGSQRNEFAVNTNILTVKAQFDLNNQMSIKTSIAPQSAVTFHLVVGAILNTAKGLHAKRERVKRKYVRKGRTLRGFSGEAGE